MSLETDVQALTTATTELLKAVTFQKSYLDAAAKAAIAGVTVQGSILPAPGKSPVGNANGTFDPAWLNPAMSLKTARVVVGSGFKYGYFFAAAGAPSARWLHIATLPPSENSGNRSCLTFKGTLNSTWNALSTSHVSILIATRGALAVEWTISGISISQTRIMIVKMMDGTYRVYVHFPANVFAATSFDLGGADVETYVDPVETNAQPEGGQIVFDSGATVGADSYIAPRWRGLFNATLNNTTSTLFNGPIKCGTGNMNDSFIAPPSAISVPTADAAVTEAMGLGVVGINGGGNPGRFGFFTKPGIGSLYAAGFEIAVRAIDSSANAWTSDLLKVQGSGVVAVPGVLEIGVINTQPQGTEKFRIVNCAKGYIVSGNYGNSAMAALNMSMHTATGRSINVSGTVNTGGNDYAEYIFKCSTCGSVAPGQIVGITADNKVTDKWDDAVMFSIKSTAPSFVGGDSWANDVGQRPSPQAGPAPSQPLRRADVVTQQPVSGTSPLEYEDVVTEPGDTDEEWAEKQAAYTGALAAHNITVRQDAEAMDAFDAALEVERQKVDRIAIAGRVPVNVHGAQPGDYIVPVQDGASIKGIAVHEDNLSMKQYFRAVGRVIMIEPDGRAYVMVKVV